MKTNTEKNTGTEQNPVVNNPIVANKRGRKANPNLTRKVYLTQDNKPRTRGAPCVGKEVRFVNIQRNIKNSEFVFDNTMEVFTENVGKRNYKKVQVDMVASVIAPNGTAVVTSVESNQVGQSVTA